MVDQKLPDTTNLDVIDRAIAHDLVTKAFSRWLLESNVDASTKARTITNAYLDVLEAVTKNKHIEKK